MKRFLILACLLFSPVASSQIWLIPYISTSQDQILETSKDIVEGMVTNFAFANKADIQKFRYKEFDKGLSQVHPVLAWATLRYLSDRSTGARQQHVSNYLAKSQALNSLNEAFMQHPESVDALEFFEAQAPKNGFKKVSEKDFLKLINQVIAVIRSKKV